MSRLEKIISGKVGLLISVEVIDRLGASFSQQIRPTEIFSKSQVLVADITS